MQGLYELAAELGLSVEEADLVTRDGECRLDLRRIRLPRNASYRLKRWTLAHELGHAVNRHQLTIFGVSDPKQERDADEWAALHLIQLEDYRAAELARDGHVPSMAYDLGVITRGVLAFQRALARIGPHVYLKPQHGAGQYADKVPA